MSAETKIDDLLAKYINDPEKSLIGFKVQYGPFLDAYVNGKIIIFDETNLASANILQCIQQPLDNNFISLEINGNCLLKKKKHKNFGIIATQNPNKGIFEGKRQELGPEFLSRFQRINFPDITKEEMKKIAFGIAKNHGYLKSKSECKDEKEENERTERKELLKNIVNFHYEWINNKETKDEIHCLTIRQIESAIDFLNNKKYKDPYNIMMTIYGGRIKPEHKKRLVEKLKNNHINYTEENKIIKDFSKLEGCFYDGNNSLVEAMNKIKLALKNKRNVLIVSNQENGLTQIAEWCAFDMNKKKRPTFFCTKNLEISDLIGSQKLVDSKIQFRPGFLYEAIEKGYCVVLDSIDEAPSIVIERLNGLLDKKNNDKENIFEVPEESSDSKIKIGKHFRIICTTTFSKINQISPSFVNRFEVIALEDQLKGIDKEKLIKFLCNKFQNYYFIQIQI